MSDTHIHTSGTNCPKCLIMPMSELQSKIKTLLEKNGLKWHYAFDAALLAQLEQLIQEERIKAKIEGIDEAHQVVTNFFSTVLANVRSLDLELDALKQSLEGEQ